MEIPKPLREGDVSLSSAGLENEPPTIADFFLRFLLRYEIVILILLLTCVFLVAVICSLHKQLWFDEIFTAIVAMQPNWHRFVQAMPAEGNPPLNTALTRMFFHLFGISAFAVRLTSMLGFVGALAGIYIFVRRECGLFWGLLGVALTLGEPAWKYSFEGRPYGMLMGMLMLAFVSWQSATRAKDATPQRGRGLALLGMCVGIAGCMLSHNIGVVDVGLPLLVGEGVRSYRRRKLDWPLLATGLVSFPALAIILPGMHRTTQTLLVHSPFLTHPITLRKLHEYFQWSSISWPLVMDTGLLVTLGVVLLFTWAPRRRGTTATEVSAVAPHIFAAILAATVLIPFTCLSLIPAHGWYFCRYGIGSVLGVSILACLLLSRRGARMNAIAASLLMCCLFLYFQTFVAEKHIEPVDLPLQSLIYSDTSGLPIVVVNGMYYPTIWWYAPAQVKDRVVYLGHPPNQDILSLIDACILAEKPSISARIEDYAQFSGSQNHFLLGVIDGGDQDLKGSLEKVGFQAVPVRTAGASVLYDMSRQAVAAAH